VQRQTAIGKHTALQTKKLVNPVKLVEVSDLGIHQTRPNGLYFTPSYSRWAPLGISKGAEATALSFKSTRIRTQTNINSSGTEANAAGRSARRPHLGHLNSAEMLNFEFLSEISVKLRAILLFKSNELKKRRTRDFTELNGPKILSRNFFQRHLSDQAGAGVDSEPSAVASVLLGISKGAQCP
jgi:hypothetical protein